MCWIIKVGQNNSLNINITLLCIRSVDSKFIVGGSCYESYLNKIQEISNGNREAVEQCGVRAIPAQLETQEEADQVIIINSLKSFSTLH